MQLDGGIRSKFKENVEKEVEGEGGGHLGHYLIALHYPIMKPLIYLGAKLRNLCTNASFLFSLSVLHVDCE